MKSKLRAIIVDDEPHALLLFKKVIEWYADQIEIVGEANDLPKVIQLIKETKPDVIFLDIEMPNYSGLQIDDFFGQPRDFEIVYITAHNDYSIKALRINAFDYLLKPLNANDLKDCLFRLQAKKENQQKTIPHLNSDYSNRLLEINSKNGVVYLKISEIIMIQASSMYSVLTIKTEEHVVSKPLKEFEFLTQYNFFRIHRSYMINCFFVQKIINQNGHEIKLHSGVKLPIAKNRIEDFKTFMQNQNSLAIVNKDK